MVELTFEVPDRLLGQFYIAVGAVLKRGHEQSTTPQAEPELHDWGTEAFDSERAHKAWRKFSPRAQAVCETGSYWMDPETARLFIAARERSLATQADIGAQS